MSDANSALRAKEEECGKLAMERDLLATQLAEQKELLVKTQREAEETETALLAEFASERSSWSDKEALLSSGFHEIEDIVDGEFLYFLSSSCRLKSCRHLVFDLLLRFFVSLQTSSLGTRRPPSKPSRLTVKVGGRKAQRSPPTPPEPLMSIS